MRDKEHGGNPESAGEMQDGGRPDLPAFRGSAGSDAGVPGRAGEVSPGSCTLCTGATAVLGPTKVGVAESPAGGATNRAS